MIFQVWDVRIDYIGYYTPNRETLFCRQLLYDGDDVIGYEGFMKLHRDKFSFLNIIGLIHGVTGIREDILEKDLLPFEFVTNQWKKLQDVLNDI